MQIQEATHGFVMVIRYSHNVSVSFIPAENDPRFEAEKEPGSIFVDYAVSESALNSNLLQEVFHMNPGWGKDNKEVSHGIGWYNISFSTFTYNKNYWFTKNRKTITAYPNN